MLLPAGIATESQATSSDERGKLAATFYLAGGLVAFLAALAPHAHTWGLVAVGLTAVTVAVASYLFRRAFMYWTTLVTSVAGPALIAAGVLAGDGTWASAVTATLYSFVAIHTALVLRWQHAALIQLWAGTTAATAGWLVAPDFPVMVVAATYLLVCGTLWAVTTRLVIQIRTQAATDPLTGLANRATFTDALEHAQATVRRTREPLSLIALDLDGFKQINDTYGHAAGDATLVAVARAWSRQLRARDTLARTGGDEFIAVLPGADHDQAAQVAVRLQDATPPHVSCSVGVATWAVDQTTEDVIKAADRALYADKTDRRSLGFPGSRAGSVPTEPRRPFV